MPAPAAPFPPDAVPDELLRTLLDVLPTAVQLWRPLYALAGGELVDFSLEYLNPAGQQQRRLPGRTLLSFFAPLQAPVILARCRQAFETNTAAHHDFADPAAGADRRCQLVARRSGPLLVVSLTSHAARPDPRGELAGSAVAEVELGELRRAFEQAPVGFAVLRGPRYVIELANPTVCTMWGRSQAQALHTPLFELLPEVAGQGFEELMDGVLATGVPFVAHELPSFIDRQGRRQTVYWSFVYHPLREADGRITGIIMVATDVSEPVEARRQVQHLNDALAATNEELRVANEEGLANYAELRESQQQLLILAQELEARVQDRTAQLLAARTGAEQQRTRLERLFMAAPAAICILSGPELVYELVNPGYQELFAGRELLGRRLAEAFPELAGHDVLHTFRRVYETGRTNREENLLIPFLNPTSGQLQDRYFNFIQQARFDEHGCIDGVVVFGYEVTEQVEARQEIEQQRQVLHSLFMEAPIPIVILAGPEMVYQLVNPAYQQLFPGRELLGKALMDALPELADSPIPALLRQVYGTGTTATAQELPVRLARHHGGPLENIYWTFTCQARRDAHGAVDGVLIFAHDMTDQVRARQGVLESEEKARRPGHRQQRAGPGQHPANAHQRGPGYLRLHRLTRPESAHHQHRRAA
ncbi:PAS domain S-box-containing protein [Hymenobacter daecheongensis DSM 21074]|uniref:PAS domain S-box-containing protein n=1 Tax=Hymenobacter daecheongensis DSM 21074 TaxID=1121955 RepID=A0A1M6CWC6_9BACT|nr:PAS domain-containing protein [Hymenobacter daecheongensis]SHI65114.1 PAS domain S-box-containing protein [Hymenobacter daecheongensis DSM 21074]